MRKRIFLVNRDFQLRYSAAAVVVGFLSTLLTTGILLIPLYIFEILRIPRFLPTPILLVMAVACLVNILTVGLLGIFVTHKIAGPMFSLVRHFRKVEGGVWYGEMHVRPQDDLRYVVRNFNEMLNGIRGLAKGDLELVEEALAMPDKARENLLGLRERVRERLHPPGFQQHSS